MEKKKEDQFVLETSFMFDFRTGIPCEARIMSFVIEECFCSSVRVTAELRLTRRKFLFLVG